MTIGVDDTVTVLSVPAAAERVLALTQAARPADLPVLLVALPGRRARLADMLSGAVRPRSPAHLADTATGGPELELRRVLAGARDQTLSIPAARSRGRPEPLPARRPGWRDQAWVQGWDRP